MQIKALTLTLAVLTLQLTRANYCRADLILAFSTDGGTTFTNSIETVMGTTVGVDVYARETGASENRLSSFGLINMGSLGRFTPGQAVVNNVETDAAFSNNSLATVDNLDGILIIAGSGPLQTGSVVPAKGESIRLGKFSFQLSGPSASFQFGDRDREFGIGGNFEDMVQQTPDPGAADPDFPDLDPVFFGSDIQSTYTLTASVSAVPEPTALLFAALAGVAILLHRRRLVRRVC